MSGNGVQKSLTTSERRKVSPHLNWVYIESIINYFYCNVLLALYYMPVPTTKFAFFRLTNFETLLITSN